MDALFYEELIINFRSKCRKNKTTTTNKKQTNKTNKQTNKQVVKALYLDLEDLKVLSAWKMIFC